MKKSISVLVSIMIILYSLTISGIVNTNAATSSNWSWPTYNHNIQNDWPNYPGGGYHAGTDFPVPLNTPVYSSCDGEVVSVLTHTGDYGKHVKIKAVVSGTIVYIRYAHLNSFAVNVGDKVTSGQLIAYSGSTGNSTGPHLHYEVRNSNDFYGNSSNPTLNPKYYLPGTSLTFDSHKETFVDLGTDFFALIMNKAMWKPLTVEQNKNVDIKCGKYYDCPDQIWKFERQSDGSYKIISASNQDCLDVDGASTSPGANVQAFVDHGHDAQRWYVIERNGGVVLKSKISNCVLEVNGGNATDGTNVQMNIENDSDAQIFSIYKVDSNSFALNIGNDFTAPIFNLYHWLPIENDENNNVVIGHENGMANQVWRFLRQTDGSYKIVSCLDGKCLDVQGASYEGGANVQVFTDHSHDAQRWYIFSYNGGYMLQSKLSGLFLDLYQCIPDEGNNIDLWSRNYSESQIFSFYNGEECKLSSPVLNVNVDSKNIKFSWNNVYGENYYNLRIWNEKHWENDSYLNLWNIPANKTETDIQLPAGNFEAYVDTGNYYDVRMSNVVSFTVKPKINTRIMNNKSVVFNWDEVLKAKSYNLEIINKSNNGVISKNNLTENSFITFLDSGKYSVRIISDNNVVSDSMDFEIEYKDQLIGDVNNDGIVSIADATTLQKYLANIVDFDDEQLAVADTNGDGSVSIADATQIQKYLAQLIPSLG